MSESLLFGKIDMNVRAIGTFGQTFCDSAYFYYYNETVEICTRARAAIQSEKSAEGESAFSFNPLFCLIWLHVSVTVGWIDSQSNPPFLTAGIKRWLTSMTCMKPLEIFCFPLPSYSPTPPTHSHIQEDLTVRMAGLSWWKHGPIYWYIL